MTKFLVKVVKTTKEYWHVEADTEADAKLFYDRGENTTKPRVIDHEVSTHGEIDPLSEKEGW